MGKISQANPASDISDLIISANSINSKINETNIVLTNTIGDLKKEVKNNYATKVDLGVLDKKCEDEYMKKVANKIYVKYLIISMDEYKTVQVSMADKSNEHPAEGSTIMQAYGQAWITACNIRNWYLDEVANRSSSHNDFWVEYNSLDEIIQELTMYKSWFRLHTSYTYSRYLYDHMMSSKCFGCLDNRRKELKEFYKYNSKKSEFYLDVNRML